jgi:hypothetical protein
MVLNKITYGDFDALIETPVAVSLCKESLLMRKSELETKLSKQDKENGFHYEIDDNLVELI